MVLFDLEGALFFILQGDTDAVVLEFDLEEDPDLDIVFFKLDSYTVFFDSESWDNFCNNYMINCAFHDNSTIAYYSIYTHTSGTERRLSPYRENVKWKCELVT